MGQGSLPQFIRAHASVAILDFRPLPIAEADRGIPEAEADAEAEAEAEAEAKAEAEADRGIPEAEADGTGQPASIYSGPCQCGNFRFQITPPWGGQGSLPPFIRAHSTRGWNRFVFHRDPRAPKSEPGSA